jgi:hypothetical protein
MSITDAQQNILMGFIKVNIFFHATQDPLYGLGPIEDLDRLAHDLGLGTLYPQLPSIGQA